MARTTRPTSIDGGEEQAPSAPTPIRTRTRRSAGAPPTIAVAERAVVEHAREGATPLRTVQPISVPFEQLRRPLTPERVAERAYFLSLAPDAGSDEQNWLRAEHQLLAELLWEQAGLGPDAA